MSQVRSIFIAAVAVTLFAGTTAAQDWNEITPVSGPAPAARTLSAAVYDPVAHAMVVFGGQVSGGARVNDIWAFDLATNTWTDLTPGAGSAPVGRITPASVYDTANHQMLMFSGQGAGSLFLNDTWGFDLNTNTWTQFSPAAPIPTTRYGVAGCYDEIGQAHVIFAGFTFQGRFDDTWRFDPGSDAWTDVSPVSGSPLERCLHSGCYDAVNRRLIMYGGQNGGPLGDIWAYDIAAGTWTELTPASSPDPRWFSTFEYDTNNHRATMFSGNRSGLGKANDVWVFDLYTNLWVELFPAGTAPAARDGAASVYIASEDRMVIFGGNTTAVQNDVWSLENLSDTPSSISSGTPSPNDPVLHQNFPNPFNPTTAIGFELGAPARVALTIYDLTGAVVRTLVDGSRGAGPHRVTWDGTNDAGVRVSTGVYLYRLRAGGEIRTRKMVLLK